MPGCCRLSIDLRSEVRTRERDAGILMGQQAQFSNIDLDLRCLRWIVEQAIGPTKGMLVHGTAGGHANVLIAIPARVLQ